MFQAWLVPLTLLLGRSLISQQLSSSGSYERRKQSSKCVGSHMELLIFDCDCTVPEIEQYHQHTLKAVLDKVNDDISDLEAKQRREQERHSEQLRQHRASVEEAAKRIRFD